MMVTVDAPAYIVAIKAPTGLAYEWLYVTEVWNGFGNYQQKAYTSVINPMLAKLYTTETEAQEVALRVGGYVMEVAAAGGRV